MSTLVSHLVRNTEQRNISWNADGRVITLQYDPPVRALRLRSGTAVLVVEPGNGYAPHNAAIFNADGTLRTRVHNPEAQNGAIAFDDAYYVIDELTLIIAFSSSQMACVIDENGTILRTYETR